MSPRRVSTRPSARSRSVLPVVSATSARVRASIPGTPSGTGPPSRSSRTEPSGRCRTGGRCPAFAHDSRRPRRQPSASSVGSSRAYTQVASWAMSNPWTSWSMPSSTVRGRSPANADPQDGPQLAHGRRRRRDVVPQHAADGQPGCAVGGREHVPPVAADLRVLAAASASPGTPSASAACCAAASPRSRAAGRTARRGRRRAPPAARGRPPAPPAGGAGPVVHRPVPCETDVTGSVRRTAG